MEASNPPVSEFYPSAHSHPYHQSHMPPKRTFNVSDIPRTRKGVTEVITDRRGKSGVRHKEVPIELPREVKAGKASTSKRKTQKQTEMPAVDGSGGPVNDVDPQDDYFLQFDTEETYVQPAVQSKLFCLYNPSKSRSDNDGAMVTASD